MRYVKLGSTGLDVSAIALGTMTYGDISRGGHQWALDEESSRPYYREAVDAGINFFDTANVYSGSSSEEFLGRALKDLGVVRDETVIATKVHGVMRDAPNGKGLSRKAILQEIDNSLRRLQTDYVDLYQIHRFDPATPLEETLEALHDVVKSGKARYIGASSMWTWQFAKALFTQKANGWSRFVTMQDHYNLLTREEEREMYPFLADQGIGALPWSPLARGKLARASDEPSTTRADTDQVLAKLYTQVERSDAAIIDAVGSVAARHEVSRAQIALAWVLTNPVVSAPIVGASKPHHLSDAIAALDVELTSDDIAELEAPYIPRLPEGF